MDPSDAMNSDQAAFEKDLEAMISEMLVGSSSSNATSAKLSSPQSPVDEGKISTSNKRPRSAISPATEFSPSSPPATKRPKVKPTGPSYRLHMHPSRQARLSDQPSTPSSSRDHASTAYTFSPLVSGSLSDRRSSATRLNATPLGSSTGNAQAPSTHSTLSNVVRRQWDEHKKHLAYHELLEHRRNEQTKLTTVDRYVPIWTPGPTTGSVKNRSFPYEKLPEDVRDKILSLLLVSLEPIEIDFNWLRPFVKGHARVPMIMQKLESDDGTSYFAPISWPKLIMEVKSMKSDMAKFNHSLEIRGEKTKGKRSPARHLTTALFSVSRSFHEAAARTFYAQNVFHFSYVPAAWMHLESFLETIGQRNVELIKYIRIAAPMFHRGMQEDYVEGAMMDALSPATRLVVISSASRDRLLSAIKFSLKKIMTAGALETLAIDLEYPMAADHWTGRYTNDKRLISAAEAEEHVERKSAGIALLKEASNALTAKGSKPVLTLTHFARASRTDVNDFRRRLAGLNTEAEKYGWQVNPRLQHGR